MARNSEALRLRSIAEELASIASALKPDIVDIAPPADPADDLGEYARITGQEQRQLFEYARNIYRGRRMRAGVIGDESLFGEPAWDLLLDLFIAEAEGKRLSVTAACIGAAVPTSTALRWIVILESRGLVRRENDPTDARRVFLHLTSEGYTRMTRYFLQLQRENAIGA